MKRVETFRWYLPPKPWAGPRAKPYLSSWHMDAEEAAKLGALHPESTSRRVLEKPETDEEQRAHTASVDTAAFQKHSPAMTPNERLALVNRAPDGFDVVPPGAARAAHDLVAAGWRPRRELGVIATVDRPRAGRWQVTDNAVWSTMCMMALQRAGTIRESSR